MDTTLLKEEPSDKKVVKSEKAPRPRKPEDKFGVPTLREEFDRLHSEIDRMFGDWMPQFRGSWGLPRFGRRAFEFPSLERLHMPSAVSPKVDVRETDKEFTITAELAGMGEKDIEVVVSDDILTIKGQKNEEKEEKEGDYHLSERRFGSFARSFELPPGVDQNKIKADFEKGVLRIVVAKSKDAKKKEKKIAVKVGKVKVGK